MYRTGTISHPLYLEHDTGSYHPESSRRLEGIYAMLGQPDMADRFVKIEPRPATKEEICRIHDESYYQSIAQTAGSFRQLDPDTTASPKSFEAAVLAAGGCLAGLDAIYEGNINNAFALVRPPGHHAEAWRSAGFCLFNNVAIAAKYAMDKYGCERVLIVDWDLHHGNGTQHSFYDTKQVLYISTHQFPYYPGTGDYHEVGSDEGEGYTINFPLATGYGDADYLQIFEQIIKPVALEYQPDLVLLSAGFDTYYQDPLGGMKVTPQGYAAMMDVLMTIAETCCQGRLLVTLEGGYHIEGLVSSVKECLNTMLLPPDQREKHTFEIGHLDSLPAVIERVRSIQAQYWDSI